MIATKPRTNLFLWRIKYAFLCIALCGCLLYPHIGLAVEDDISGQVSTYEGTDYTSGEEAPPITPEGTSPVDVTPEPMPDGASEVTDGLPIETPAAIMDGIGSLAMSEDGAALLQAMQEQNALSYILILVTLAGFIVLMVAMYSMRWVR